MSSSQADNKSTNSEESPETSPQHLEDENANKVDDETGKNKPTSDGAAQHSDDASSNEDDKKDDDDDDKEDDDDDEEKTGQENAAANPRAGADGQIAPLQQHDWQAIYSPQHNAYYFYNTKTQVTTWTNPLVPSSGSEQPSTSDSTSYYQQQTAVIPGSTSVITTTKPALEGIDPELAYLDPTGAHSGFGTAGAGAGGTYSARFNARTGRFTAMDGRDPSHLSEYERAKRMSSAFFDVNAWEQEVAERKAREDEEEESGRRKRRKPSKADLERFRSQKEARKKTKYAWLRD